MAFALLQLDVSDYVEHVISKVNQSTCLLYSSSHVLLVFDHAETIRHIQTAGKMDRYSSRVACRQILACVHVFCRSFIAHRE